MGDDRQDVQESEKNVYAVWDLAVCVGGSCYNAVCDAVSDSRTWHGEVLGNHPVCDVRYTFFDYLCNAECLLDQCGDV